MSFSRNLSFYLDYLIRVTIKKNGFDLQIPVEDRKMEDEDDEDPTYCEICGRCDREDRLLLCDGCDQG